MKKPVKRGRGRPPLPEEERLVNKVVKLRPEQFAWLNSQVNGNKSVRDLIDKEMNSKKVP